MRKTRLYLEASPIIMMEPDQDPVRQAITKEFFRIVAKKPDEYELFVSPVTIEELRTTAPLVVKELPNNAPLYPSPSLSNKGADVGQSVLLRAHRLVGITYSLNKQ